MEVGLYPIAQVLIGYTDLQLTMAKYSF